jgi:hypothetical protein
MRKSGESSSRTNLGTCWKLSKATAAEVLRDAFIRTRSGRSRYDRKANALKPDAYLGGIDVPNVGCASFHGFPSTSAMCALQTRFTTNGHLAAYFASRGQRCASQCLLSESESNSGPRLFVSIAAPVLFCSI